MVVLDTFYDLTKYDISKFLSDFNYFTKTYYLNIVRYYNGKDSVLDQSVNELYRLINEVHKIEELFSLNQDQLSVDLSFWDLLTDVTEIRTKLYTTLKMGKWCRSSYTFDYNSNAEFDYILKQNQSVEDLSSNLGYKSPHNDWVDLAVKNQLKESDYTSEGGNLLKVTFSFNNLMNTTSIVAVITGENILGIDLPVDLSYENDDFKVLSIKETLQQSAEILLSLTKGSIPEFPNDGVNKELIGSSINALQFPSIFRQLTDVFRKDDSFKTLELIDLSFEQDGVMLSFKIISKLNDVIGNQQLILSN